MEKLGVLGKAPKIFTAKQNHVYFVYDYCILMIFKLFKFYEICFNFLKKVVISLSKLLEVRKTVEIIVENILKYSEKNTGNFDKK